MSIKAFHFDLGSDAHSLSNLTLHIGLNKYDLNVHTPETLAKAALNNKAIGLMPESQRQRITHYAEVREDHLPTDRLTRIKVTTPYEDPGVSLPRLIHVSFHIPETVRRKHISKKFKEKGHHPHPKLQAYGVDMVNEKDALEVHLLSDDFKTPLDAAKAVLFYHPELATRNVQTAAVVMDDHIYPKKNPDQWNAVNELATYISGHHNDWCDTVQSTDKDGNKMYYEHEEWGHKMGDPVMVYKYSEGVEQIAKSPAGGALQTSKQDPLLQGIKWNVSQGITAKHQENEAQESITFKAAAVEKAGEGFKWTVQEVTAHHGLEVDTGALRYSDETFSIDVKNTYLRHLCAYVQFFDESGAQIDLDDPNSWKDNIKYKNYKWPNVLGDLSKIFETNYKKYLCPVSAVNVILGIPLPADPTTIQFPVPEGAVSFKILCGGLGTSRWDSDVDPSGTILTGIFEYGIPILFLAAGALIEDTEFFLAFMQAYVATVLEAALPVVGTGEPGDEAIENAKSILLGFADGIAGILVKKGMEKLAKYITEKLTEAELEDAIPFVGWALRAANMLIDFGEMIETTVEVLSSPATLEVDIKRVISVQLTLHPDPKHGEPDKPQTAVWPAVSDHFQIILQYEEGTDFVQIGKMTGTTSSTPLVITYPEVPGGGRIQLIAGIYSKSGWLCGKYRSDWMDAVPNSVSTLTVEGNITEILVPLTQDTQYNYKEKIVYDTGSEKHVWHAGDMPTATLADLHCVNTGNQICELVNITINDKAYQIGYTWQASGQGLPLEDPNAPADTGQEFTIQNLSVLADPQSRVKFPKIAFKVQPYIAYDQFGPEPQSQKSAADEINQDNFIIDSRNLDNKNPEYHLRQVVLNGGSDFGLTDPGLQSWGRFTIPHLDAIVVHPSRAVIAVSWQYSKMQILKLPDKPVDDKNAPYAQNVSGLGIRQGLMNKPAAITVAPDGRVLVLETGNQRIQGFDTRGNPVPGFVGQLLFTLPSSDYMADLNNGVFSAALQQQFQPNGLTHIFDLDPALQSDLDKANLSNNLVNAFADEYITLTYNPDKPKDPSVSTYITVNTPGSSWTITDPNKIRVYDITKTSSKLEVFDVLNNVTVTVRAKDKQWIAADLNGARSYDIEVDESDNSKLNLYEYLSYMPLYNPKKENVTYLDLAAESKGFIYVLSYINAGKTNSDYRLDIYQPDGTFLVRSPDEKLQPAPLQYMSAARLTLDIWRNVFTLNYELITGTDGKTFPAGWRTEPSISHWIPTPPLFDLDFETKYKEFDNADINAIKDDFIAHGFPLKSPTVSTLSKSSHWQVKDGNKIYDAVRCLDKIEVYSIPGGV
jgi:hypothetical protein